MSTRSSTTRHVTSRFRSLPRSQDVPHATLGKVDIGHMIIGLNARSSWTSRVAPLAGTNLSVSVHFRRRTERSRAVAARASVSVTVRLAAVTKTVRPVASTVG
jgi:hypothetical protein